MSLAFYIDHNVKSAIARGLRLRGVDCLTCEEDGTKRLDDPALLDRARALGRVLFSHDDDLLAITHEQLRAGRPFAGLVYAHPLRITIGQAIADLELMAKIVTPEEMRDKIEYVPLK